MGAAMAGTALVTGMAAEGALAAAAVIAVAGALSAGSLARTRQRADAAWVAVASLALALLVSEVSISGLPAGTLRVESGLTPQAVRAAADLSLQGDGLRAAEWHDLPTRNLRWTAPSEPTVTLAFPRQLALGRPFELTLQRSQALARWRLQLLDENGRLLAQASADPSGREARLSWLPPLAEQMVLQARVLDVDGRVLEHGPVPLQVHAARPLQVRGRFGAASFDVQALNSLLVASDALLDWQVTLGKTVTRQETARSALTAPDLLVIDAAFFEHATPLARAALLTQVAQGLPLLVLATNASDPALWARELQLPLRASPGEVTRTPGPDASLVLSAAAWVPAAGPNDRLGPWRANDLTRPWLWQRSWQAGRMAWLGVSDWHRAAISRPQALGAWWQLVLDQLDVRQARALTWHFPDAMPLVGERTAVCARGERAEMAVDLPGLQQLVQLQRRADQADAACAAFWPAQAGWQRVPGGGSAEVPAAVYVYAADDWPQWQRALRQAATARYAARALPDRQAPARPLPGWPWAMAFVAAMLVLWWRERR
jgi:hypothetical protein